MDELVSIKHNSVELNYNNNYVNLRGKEHHYIAAKKQMTFNSQFYVANETINLYYKKGDKA